MIKIFLLSITADCLHAALPFCTREGWKEEELLRPSNRLQKLDIVRKGLVYELFSIYKRCNVPWNQFSTWLKQLYGASVLPRKDTILKSLAALHSKRNTLLKSAPGRTKLDSLLEEPYVLPTSRKQMQMASSNARHHETTSESRAGVPSSFLQETMQIANKELAAESLLFRQKCQQLEDERDDLLAKLREYKPHNIRRRERRKQKIIKEQRKIIKSYKKSLKHASKATHRATLLYAKQCYYKSKYQAAKEHSCSDCDHEELEAANKQLQQTVIELREANAVAHDKILELENTARTYTLFNERRYTDSVRVCVMELLTNGVPVHKVETVLKSVFKMVDISYDRLPKHSIVNEMLVEARSLSQLQIAEQLSEVPFSTLHSDGTTKFGHKYLGFQVSTNEDSYTLGLMEVACGDADTMLTTMKEILHDIEQTASFDESSTTEVGKKIVSNIKNTMSDRAATQKCFNELLEAYRMEILPEVVSEWDDLSTDEKDSMATIYHFFCGVHLIGNMADHAAEALKLFEMSYREDEQSLQESGPVRLVRTACKAFERRGSEKSGHPLKFAAFLRRKGIHKVPLDHFKGNRFNILFHNAAGVYFLRSLLTEFLTDVWGTSNKLLKSVLDDLKNDFNVAGCKVLGLINKLVSAPFWRALESSKHILDVPKICSKLLSFFQTCEQDIEHTKQFMQGEYTPFPRGSINIDDVWVSLVQPSEVDPLVSLMLQAVFHALSLLVAKFVNDNSTPSDALSLRTQHETMSVKTSNIISERDFAKLDHLICQKPGASLLALEAHIMFTNNQTSEWLSQKSDEERERLVTVARKIAPTHRKKFKERLAYLRVQQEEALKEKEEAAERQRERILLQKEKLTGEIVKLGLWQTPQDVDACLQGLRSETSKRDSIKTQLRFRKTVLEQKYRDMSVFQFSSNRVHFTSTKLKENLLLLLADATRHQEVAIISDSPIQLVGAHIDHQFTENDQLVTYSGEVISQVPGFSEWFNVVYDNEPGIVYTYKLMDDFKNGDLKLV